MIRFSTTAAIFSLFAAFGSFAPSALAQQMDHSNMPGMNMPGNAGQSGRAPAASGGSQQGGTAGATSGGTEPARKTAAKPKTTSTGGTTAAGASTQARAARPDRN